MKYILLSLPLLSSIIINAQNNYIATSPISATPANFNTIVGPYAGTSAMSGNSNTFVGALAGQSNQDGYQNTSYGAQSGQFNSSGHDNVFVGYLAGYGNSKASFNTFLGSTAGRNTHEGEKNVFLGYAAGFLNDSGQNNVYVGLSAGYNNKTGSNNALIGYASGFNLTYGNNNVIVGPSSGTILTGGSGNVLLGYNAQASYSSIQNSVAIGINSKVSLNDAIVLGDPTNTSIAVGIGTDSPKFPLDVRGTINIQGSGTLKFSHISNHLYQGATDKFLTVNEQGETVLARYQLRINNTDEWSDKVFSPTYQLRPIANVATYINQHGHLPGVPSLMEVVRDGIDLVKMNALLLEKVEELTLYTIGLQKQIDELKKSKKK